MGEHSKTRGRPGRTATLVVVEIRLSEGGLMTTRMTEYPGGVVGAVYPKLAWEGVWDGPTLPVVARELVSVHQALVEVIADDSRRR